MSRDRGHLIDGIVSLPDLPTPAGPAPGAPSTPPPLGGAEYGLCIDSIARFVWTLRCLPIAELRDIAAAQAETGDNLRDHHAGELSWADVIDLLDAVAALLAVADRIETRSRP